MTEPVSLAKLKAHLRISHSLQDDLLTDLITQARELVEADTWLCLIPTTRTIVRRNFPWSDSPGSPGYPNASYPGNAYQAGTFPNSAGGRGVSNGPLFLPGPPLRSVTSVNYLDTSGNSQPLTTFRTQSTAKPGWIEPAYNERWPMTRDDPNAVTIVYSTGFDAEDDNTTVKGKCPGPLKRAILLLAAEAYENAEPIAIKGRSTVDRLLEKFRIRHAGILESLS